MLLALQVMASINDMKKSNASILLADGSDIGAGQVSRIWCGQKWWLYRNYMQLISIVFNYF